ncbi:RNA-guided endonuclease InsQ/TnpB family protein [Pontibacter korlensis]|uniref:RNA-guided endonuclease InsQ/TnpB family protein n=1 Tax=Pontibacter korlensis TaxID=400092 RepID=UPI0009FF79D5|nr:RNA-guided endonuclease TnpB family protein [Pontibacter korlensis]
MVQHPFTFAGFDFTLCSTACTCRLLPLLQQTCPAPGKAPKAAVNQIKTYRFRLKPTRAQAQAFAQWLGSCRYVYNLCLDYKKQLYTNHRLSIGKNQMQQELSAIARDVEWIGCVHSQTLQEVTDRLFRSYDGFFKQGKGFPRFARRGQYRSFTYKQGVKLHENTCTVQLPKIGKVKYRKSQDVQGVIRTASVVREADGWHVALCCEVEIAPLPPVTNVLGLDMGIKSFVVTSDGQVVDNPRHLYRYQHQLRRAQRAVSRKKKGGSNRRKAVAKLARLHLKVSNTRKDFHHQLTTQLIRENQAIVVENLQVQHMLKNHKLAKSISDAGWYQFVQMLAYKSRWYGREFHKVAPNHTSQDCWVCGWRNTDLQLSDRYWTCVNGHVLDRDVNAASNIRNKAVGQTVSAWEIYKDNGSVAQESYCL